MDWCTVFWTGSLAGQVSHFPPWFTVSLPYHISSTNLGICIVISCAVYSNADGTWTSFENPTVGHRGERGRLINKPVSYEKYFKRKWSRENQNINISKIPESH